MSLFDRFAAGLETLGKKANQALDEGKLRVELVRARRRMDNAARDLGYLTYRQAKGTAAAPADVEVLTRRIAEAEAAVERLEAQIAEVRRHQGGASGGDAGRAGSRSESADASDAAGEGAGPGSAATGAAGPTSSGEPTPGS